MKRKNYLSVLKYTALGLLLGLMLLVNALLLNYQSGFSGPWFHIFDYSPDFAVIVLSPIILALLFCYIGVRHEQLVVFNEQIKDNLKREQIASSAADKQIKLLANVIAQINDSVVIMDQSGRIQWVNDGFTKITGYVLAEVVGRPPAGILHGEKTNPVVAARISEKLARGEEPEEELVIYRKNGSPCWIRTSIKPIHDEQGAVTHYIAVENDITIRKEKELAIQALYREVADFKFALDESAIVTIFDPSGKILHANRKFNEISGLRHDQLLGADYRSISLDLYEEPLQRTVWKTLQSGSVWRGELMNRSQQGVTYWTDTSIVPLMNENGTPRHFLAIQNDITARKELETELVDSKHQLEQAMKIAQLGAWAIDSINGNLYLSSELRDILRIAPQAAVGLQDFMGNVHAEDLPSLRQALAGVQQNLVQTELEFRYWVDGQLRYMHSIIAPRINEQRQPIGVFGTINDITQRKITALALRKSEEEKAAVLENAQTLICLHDLQGVIIDVNAAGQKMSGYSKEEVLGMNLRLLVSPEYQGHFESYLQEIAVARKATGTIQIINKAGKRRVWLYQNTIHENNGNTPYVIASAIDITESVKANNEIEKQRQFIRQIIDNSPNVIYVMNEQKQIVLANRTFGQYYDYDSRQMPFAHELCKGDDDIFLSDADSLLDMEEGQILRMEGSMQTPGDTENLSWFTIIKKCFKESAGKRYFLGFGMDITGRVRVENDLIAANEIVERSLRVKDQFISNMSHEIRTPLNAVIGFTDLLAETSLNHEQSEYIQIVKTASQNLLALINNILDLSKIESGNLALESQPINVRQIIIDATRIMEQKARAKGIALTTHFPGPLPEKVLGDQLRLSQVLFNLVGNAVKFTDNGFVEVSCRLVKGSDESKHYFSFAVKDTGIGVPREKQSEIFERFTQANADTERLYGGTGLGLNIAKSIVDMHGGTLSMESDPGKGTTFHFIISFKKYEESEDMTEVMNPGGERVLHVNSTRPVRVLLAEDNQINAMLAVQVLTNGGFIVEQVANGELAVQAVQEREFDVVLMDIQMPVLNGIDATKKIRALPSPAARLPIVAMTAHSLYGEMQNCFRAGMTAYVSKPFKPEGLYSTILESIRAQSENRVLIPDF
jgi:PAS domain S-box-containing protein